MASQSEFWICAATTARWRNYSTLQWHARHAEESTRVSDVGRPTRHTQETTNGIESDTSDARRAA